MSSTYPPKSTHTMSCKSLRAGPIETLFPASGGNPAGKTKHSSELRTGGTMNERHLEPNTNFTTLNPNP